MAPIDFLTAAAHPNPAPWYRARQAAGPDPAWDPVHGVWVAMRPETVRAALAHPDLHVRPVDAPVPPALAGTPAGDWFGRLVRMNDAPHRHAAPKAALRAALDAIDRPTVDTAVQAAWADCGGTPTWTADLPVRALAALIGLPRATHGAVLAATRTLADAVGGRADGAGAGPAAIALVAALEAVVDAAETLPSVRSADGAHARNGHAWLDALLVAPGCTRPALLANLAGLLTQTHDATAGLLGNAVVAVARGASAADPDALVAAVLRDDPPIHHTRRYAAAPLRLSDADLPAGAVVGVVLGPAGCPFGHGRHACPGERLATWIASGAVSAAAASGLAWPSVWRYRPLANARVPDFTPAPDPAAPRFSAPVA